MKSIFVFIAVTSFDKMTGISEEQARSNMQF